MEKINTDVLVLGAGPGGYTAAFRAADLGLNVILVDKSANLGGVCLNVGCIPSKTLLHMAHGINSQAELASAGINFGKPAIDLEKVRKYKNTVVSKLTKGLAFLAKKRKVRVVQGQGRFVSTVCLQTKGNEEFEINFKYAIIASGSRPVKLPFIPENQLVWDSSRALELDFVPAEFCIIGGGIIGLEMASIYHTFGSKVTIVEMQDQLVPELDRDAISIIEKKYRKMGMDILLKTKISAVEADDKSLKINLGEEVRNFDACLVAVGRIPNSDTIGLENTGIVLDERKNILIDKQCRTNVDHIFAIGDVTGMPQLAHRSSYQGKVTAEVIAGHKTALIAQTIPGVLYTDPEVAWTGYTEKQAEKEGIEYYKGSFPFTANGRALSQGFRDGFSKLLFDKKSKRIIGGQIVGPGAGDMIGEISLGFEMAAVTDDFHHTVHPHPTFAETIGLAAEAADGIVTEL